MSGSTGPRSGCTPIRTSSPAACASGPSSPSRWPGDPQILFADEPTTALDVTVQAQILDLLRDVQQKLGTATVLVSHDLGVVARAADRVAVMYAGRIVEIGTAEEVYYDPRHPYTWALLRALPALWRGTASRSIPSPACRRR